MLEKLRRYLSPFLKAIQKCSSNTRTYQMRAVAAPCAGENLQKNKERICDEIINTASSHVDSQLRNDLSELMQRQDQRTLNKENKSLENISRRSVFFIKRVQIRVLITF